MHAELQRGDVHQRSDWIEGHGLPIMGAKSARPYGNGGPFSEVRGFDRSAGRQVDALGPSGFRELLGGNQSTGDAVDDVEEPVLGCLHQNLATLPFEVQARKNNIW